MGTWIKTVKDLVDFLEDCSQDASITYENEYEEVFVVNNIMLVTKDDRNYVVSEDSCVLSHVENGNDKFVVSDALGILNEIDSETKVFYEDNELDELLDMSIEKVVWKDIKTNEEIEQVEIWTDANGGIFM